MQNYQQISCVQTKDSQESSSNSYSHSSDGERSMSDTSMISEASFSLGQYGCVFVRMCVHTVAISYNTKRKSNLDNNHYSSPRNSLYQSSITRSGFAAAMGAGFKGIAWKLIELRKDRIWSADSRGEWCCVFSVCLCLHTIQYKIVYHIRNLEFFILYYITVFPLIILHYINIILNKLYYIALHQSK